MKNSKLEVITKEEWNSISSKSDSVFFSDSWICLLEKSFRVKTIYLYDKTINDGTIIQVFKKGPFHVGYTAFPIGSTLNGQPISSLELPRLLNIIKKHIQIVKINSSGFKKPEKINIEAHSLPETAILNLSDYNALHIAKVRRDINRAKRFSVNISSKCKKEHSFKIFHLYKQTIKRNKGVEKYNLNYFEELIVLAESNPNVSILTASIKGNFAGFLVLITENSTSYYLHGAVDEDFRSNGVTDLLIYNATELAKSLGATCFNMMTSPLGQSGLVKYKEKWGAETRIHQTYEAPLSVFWSSALKIATICNSYYHKTR